MRLAEKFSIWSYLKVASKGRRPPLTIATMTCKCFHSHKKVSASGGAAVNTVFVVDWDE